MQDELKKLSKKKNAEIRKYLKEELGINAQKNDTKAMMLDMAKGAIAEKTIARLQQEAEEKDERIAELESANKELKRELNSSLKSLNTAKKAIPNPDPDGDLIYKDKNGVEWTFNPNAQFVYAGRDRLTPKQAIASPIIMEQLIKQKYNLLVKL